MKRVQLEPWTTYEKLCLASAVQRTGDQNWTAVSRSARNIFEDSSKTWMQERRPPDWFSMKQCAAQYEYLLKNVVGPRRKKRTEKGSDSTDTPAEIIMNVLRQEHIEELKQTILEEQALYLKLKKEKDEIEAGLMDDKLEEINTAIEAKEREKDIKIKLKFKLGEKSLEIDHGNGNSPDTEPLPPPTPEKSQAPEVKSSSGTSPLLTSLLQSPSPISRPNTISLLLNSAPSHPTNESPTLSKLLESTSSMVVPPPVPAPPSAPVQSSTPKREEEVVEEEEKEGLEQVTAEMSVEEAPKPATPEPIEELVQEVVETEVVIEQDLAEEKRKSRLHLEGCHSHTILLSSSSLPSREMTDPGVAHNAGVFELDEVEMEEEVMETVEQIIEKVEETIIEAVGEEVNQAINAESLDDHLEALDLDQHAVELIVMGPTHRPVIAVDQEEEAPVKPVKIEKDLDVVSETELNIEEAVIEEELKDDKEELDTIIDESSLKLESSEPETFSEEVEDPKVELEKENAEEHEVEEELVVEVIQEVKQDFREALIEEELVANEIFVKDESDRTAADIDEGNDDKTEPDISVERIILEEVKREPREPTGSAEAVVEELVKLVAQEEQKEILSQNDRESLEKAWEPEIKSPDPKHKEKEPEITKSKEEEKSREVKEDIKTVHTKNKDKDITSEIKLKESVSAKSLEVNKDDSEPMPTELKVKENETKPENKSKEISKSPEVKIREKDLIKSTGEKKKDALKSSDTKPKEKVSQKDNKTSEPKLKEKHAKPKEQKTKEKIVEKFHKIFDKANKDKLMKIPEVKLSDVKRETKTEAKRESDAKKETPKPTEVKKEPKPEIKKEVKLELPLTALVSTPKPTSTSTPKPESSVKINKMDPPSNSESETEKKRGRKRPAPGSNLDLKPTSPAPTPVSTPSASTSYTDEDRDNKTWKKSILLVYNRLAAHKYASVFLKPITEAEAAGYHSIIRRPMDLTTIKRNIESGAIRTTVEFQRDMLLMVQNAIMYNKTNTLVYKMAHDMLADMITQMEVMVQAIGDGVPLGRETYERLSTRGRASNLRTMNTQDETPKRKRTSEEVRSVSSSKRKRLDLTNTTL